MEGVAKKNSQTFSTKIKARHEFEPRHLEAEFGQSKFFESCRGQGETDAKKILPNFKKN
jgi:hypothetical protein